MSQQYITIIVLLTGVFGGLSVVILLILCCKHCLNKTVKETGCENGVEREFSVSAALLEQRQVIIERKEVATSPFSLEESRQRQSHLRRQSEIRSDVTDQSESGNAIASELADVDQLDTPASNQATCYEPRVSGLTNIDELEIYDRLYPEAHHQQENPRWLLERDGSNHGRPLRVTNLSMTSSNRSSRRTLQSSMESSTCTDNRSETTDWMNSDYYMRRSISHEEPPSSPAPSPNRYLTPTATGSPAVERRRQLSHREVGRPREYDVQRKIKSQDDGYIYRLHKQDRLTPEDRDWDLYREDTPENIPYNNEDHHRHSNTSVHNLNSGRASPYYTERCSPHDQWVAATPVSVESGRGSTHELWKLRSNLEGAGNSLRASTSALTYSSEDSIHENMQDSIHEKACKPVQFTDEAPTTTNPVCSVVYTSFDSENMPRLPVDNNQHVDHELDQAEEPDLDNFLQPPEQLYINRRQSFQRVYSNRRRNKNLFDLNSSTERSFDSFDTYTTDGAHSSESSRMEATTTSFDSTTTADSSADSASKRQILREAKDDSGYRSTSIDYHAAVRPPPSPSTCIIITPTLEEQECAAEETVTGCQEMVPAHYSRPVSSRRRDFQTAKTAPEKPLLNIQASFSSFEIDTTDSNIASCESIQESVEQCSGRYSGFLRVLQHGRQRQRKPKRDYSIDERTDALFKEFTRHDPKYDEMCTSRSKSTGSIRLDINRDSKSFEGFTSRHWRNQSENCNKSEEPPPKNRLELQASIC